MNKKITGIILVILYLIFTVGGLILYKYGTNINLTFNVYDMNISMTINMFILVGLLFYLVSFLLYMIVLPRYNLTDVMPVISAVSTISIYIAAVFILEEVITIQKIIGISIIIVGVFLVSYNFRNKKVS